MMDKTEDISGKFPFESKYVEVQASGIPTAKLHYVEQGSGDPILFLHGDPTWSYLWRNVIPHLAPHGRCIAVDLIGMGRSDKPGIDYNFFDHVNYLEGFIEALDLKNITLVIHDWGSALGFHYARRHEANVRGMAFMEAIFRPIPGWDDLHPEFRRVFRLFRTPLVGRFLIAYRNVFIEKILPGSVIRTLTEEEMDHYRAPYPTVASRKPLWRWPKQVPFAGRPADVVEAVSVYHQWLQQTALPKLLLYAQPGAITRASTVEWCKQSMKNLKTVDIGPGRHFIQEDQPHKIGAEIAAWLKMVG